LNVANKEYPKSEGKVWVVDEKDRLNDKYPHFRGHIDVTKAQIQMLINMGKAGLEPRLQVSLWERTAEGSGKPWKYMRTEAYMKEEEHEPDVPF